MIQLSLTGRRKWLLGDDRASLHDFIGAANPISFALAA